MSDQYELIRGDFDGAGMFKIAKVGAWWYMQTTNRSGPSVEYKLGDREFRNLSELMAKAVSDHES
jgi:hypothetical protein